MRKIIASTLLLLFSAAVRSQTHQATGGTVVIGGPTGQSAIALPSSAALLGTDANGLPLAISMAAANAGVSRSLSQHFSDTFNVRDYGALGTGSTATIGTAYGSTLAQLAGYFYAPTGVYPYAWATNPAYGLTFTMTVSATQSSASTQLAFLKTPSGMIGNVTSVAQWQDPAQSNFRLLPGMLMSGSCIASGTTVVAKDSTPTDAAFGMVTESQPSTCNSGTVITFTLSPAQVQNLPYDTLGLMTAVANANTHNGTVYVPAGIYYIGHDVVSNNAGYQQIDVRGDGQGTTKLVATADLGQDECFIIEADRSGGSATRASKYHDFSVFAPNVSSLAVFSTPNKMKGLCIGGQDFVHDYEGQLTWAAVSLVGDHQTIADNNLTNNRYGIYFDDYGYTIGNQIIRNNKMVGNTVASIGVSASNDYDSGTWSDGHTGSEPFAIARYEPIASNVANPSSLLTNTKIDNVPIEGMDDNFAYGPNPGDNVNNNSWIRGGSADINQYGQATLDAAFIHANGSINGNKFRDTNLKQYDYAMTRGLFESTGACTGNQFWGDDSLLTNGNGSKSDLSCAGGVQNNTFSSAYGSGVFAYTAVPLTQGMPLADLGQEQVGVYTTGMPFAGVSNYSLAPQTINGTPQPMWFPLIQQAQSISVVKGLANTQMNSGVAMMPVTAGFVPGSSMAVGVAGCCGDPTNANMPMSINGAMGAPSSVAGVVLKVVYNGSQAALSSGSFAIAPFNSVLIDTLHDFNTSTGIYTVSVAGTYTITTKLRVQDQAPAGVSYGQGGDTTNEDSADFQWFQTYPAGATSGAQRNSSLNTITRTLNVGDQVRLVYYLDYSNGLYLNSDSMVIKREN